MTETAAVEKKWFKMFAAAILGELVRELDEGTWVKPWGRSIQVESTNTGGWTAYLGTVSGDRGGQLQLWFDCWTGGTERKIAYSYGSSSSKRISEIGEIGIGGQKIAITLREGFASRERSDGSSRMEPPLPEKRFNTPILELTERSGYKSYITVYENSSPRRASSADRKAVARATTFFAHAITTVGARRRQADLDREFPTVKNRSAVRTHRIRERNAAQAQHAKRRDDYTCCVCDMRFNDVYGPIGKNYAEAHHTKYVSKMRDGATIKVEDLVTVCANCHRMLHFMSGQPEDWKVLRTIVRKARSKRSN